MKISNHFDKALARAIVIFGSAQVLIVISTLIRSKVAAQTVGPTGVGLTALFFTITTFIATFVSFGIASGSVQTLSSIHSSGDTQREREYISLLRSWEILSGAIGMLTMIVIAPLLCTIYFGHWRSHLMSMLLMSIVPPSVIITGIEGAILKSLRQMRRLSLSLAYAAMANVAVAVPLYVLMGWNGIPYIVAGSTLLTAMMSFYYGWKTSKATPNMLFLHDWRGFLKASLPMLSLGSAFIISGICVSGTDLLLQSYINTVSTLVYVGLYKAGYSFSLTYPGMIFTAVENDFYPRLTAIKDDVAARNVLIRKQIVTLLTIVTPCIIAFIALLPWLVPLLLSDDFCEIIPMVSFGALSIIVRAAYLPIAYLPIALNRPKSFINMEVVSSIGIIVCVIGGCKIAGLTGIGVGFIVSQTFDLAYAYWYCKRKFSFRVRS